MDVGPDSGDGKDYTKQGRNYDIRKNFKIQK